MPVLKIIMAMHMLAHNLLEECNALLAHCAIYTCMTTGTKLCVLIRNYGMVSPGKDNIYILENKKNSLN